MPDVTIKGMPESVTELTQLIEYIQLTVSSISALMLSPNQVSVFLPPDLVKEGLGEELIVWVTGLFDLPERNQEVLDELAEKVLAKLMEFASIKLPQCQLIEVFVQVFGSTKTAFQSKDFK